jgi:hypothetical protein
MQAIQITRAGVIGLSFLALASCTEGSSKGKTSFQSQYATARNALEKGDFDSANRMYLRLAPDAGALQPRVRLELSHSYLRSGNFKAAAAEAGKLAQSQSGAGRAAALSVQATADHELGIAALADGDAKAGKTHLMQAEQALTELLASNPEFDPLGSLAGRRATIAARLKGMP